MYLRQADELNAASNMPLSTQGITNNTCQSPTNVCLRQAYEFNAVRTMPLSTQEIANSACQSLTNVYLRQADEFNAAKDTEAALDAYNKCLNAAERADNPLASSKAHYQMGMLYHQHEKWAVRSWRANFFPFALLLFSWMGTSEIARFSQVERELLCYQGSTMLFLLLK